MRFQAVTGWDAVQAWRAGPTSRESVGVTRHSSVPRKKELTVAPTDPTAPFAINNLCGPGTDWNFPDVVKKRKVHKRLGDHHS